MNHWKKALACTMSAFVLTGALTFLPTKTEVHAEGEKEAYQAALAQYNLGSLGYFQEKADAGNQYAAVAVNVLKTASAKVINGQLHDGVEAGLTHIGAADDATSLENMKNGLEMMKHGNQLRTTDNNFPGLSEWIVRDDLMAYAQASANMESQFIGHWVPDSDAFADVPPTAEIASWGRQNTPGAGDHYAGWYTQEKQIYDSKGNGETGHYLNMVSSEFVTTGIGVNERSPIYVTTATQDFSWETDGAVSWQDYYNDFMNYYNKVTNNLKKATADYTVTMYRLYNPNSGEHFYTSAEKEKNHLVSLGWIDEGVGWYAPKSGNAVYRLYNGIGGEHHYTLSTKERDALINAGWKYEGTGWYSDEDQTTPVYRQYNPNAFANNHNYTTDEHEKNTLVAIGWRDEKIGWYAVRAGK